MTHCADNGAPLAARQSAARARMSLPVDSPDAVTAADSLPPAPAPRPRA
ncbi:AI-2E family transporter, partial [Xanthomonas perforans]